MGGLGYLIYMDYMSSKVKDFGAGAIREGGFLFASSSKLPLYPVSNAFITEDELNGNYTFSSTSSSWCASSN